MNNASKKIPKNILYLEKLGMQARPMCHFGGYIIGYKAKRMILRDLKIFFRTCGSSPREANNQFKKFYTVSRTEPYAIRVNYIKNKNNDVKN